MRFRLCEWATAAFAGTALLFAGSCGDVSDQSALPLVTTTVPLGTCDLVNPAFAPSIEVPLYYVGVADILGVNGDPLPRWAVVSAGGAVFLSASDPEFAVEGLIMAVNLESARLLGYNQAPDLSTPAGVEDYLLGDASVLDDPMIPALIACAKTKADAGETSPSTSNLPDKGD